MDALQVDPLVFKEMYNLKYLVLYDTWKKLKFPQGVQRLPDELRYLNWIYYPSKSLPFDFKPQNLVELHLPESPIKHLWSGSQVCFSSS